MQKEECKKKGRKELRRYKKRIGQREDDKKKPVNGERIKGRQN